MLPLILQKKKCVLFILVCIISLLSQYIWCSATKTKFIFSTCYYSGRTQVWSIYCFSCYNLWTCTGSQRETGTLRGDYPQGGNYPLQSQPPSQDAAETMEDRTMIPSYTEALVPYYSVKPDKHKTFIQQNYVKRHTIL